MEKSSFLSSVGTDNISPRGGQLDQILTGAVNKMWLLVVLKYLQIAIISHLIDVSRCAKRSMNMVWLDLHSEKTCALGLIICNLQMRKCELRERK